MAHEQANNRTVPWYRHPIAAIMLGLFIGSGSALCALRYALPTVGLIAVPGLLVFPAPAVAGFAVGALSRRDGAKWAVTASIVFLLVVVFAGVLCGNPADLGRVVALGALPAVSAGVFGYLGESVARAGRKALCISIVAWVIVLTAIVVPVWLRVNQVNQEVAEFRTHVLPGLQHTLDTKLIHLPKATQWAVRREAMLWKGMIVTTEGKGHSVYLNVSPDGKMMWQLRYDYQPAKAVHLKDLKSAEHYLRSLGVADKLLSRLKRSENAYALADSWLKVTELVSMGKLAHHWTGNITLELSRDGSVRMWFHFVFDD